MPPLPARACQTCGAAFVPGRNGRDRKYCSRRCFEVAHVQTMRRINEARHGDKRTTIPCPICGTAMERNPSQAKARRHCSKACDSEARRRVTGESHPLYKPATPMPCEVCGTVRLVKPSRVATFRACSRRCAATLGKIEYPRVSSLETAVAAVLDALGERYEAQAVFRWYVVDFYLPDRALVIECDGAYWHAKPKQQRIDRSKDGYLRNRGIRVARLGEAAIKSDARAAVKGALHG